MNSPTLYPLRDGDKVIRDRLRARVAVFPETELSARERLFALLGQLYSVDFEVYRQMKPRSMMGYCFGKTRKAKSILRQRPLGWNV
jgi:hypothetical protein